MSIVSRAAAIRSWNPTRDAVARSAGELRMSSASTGPALVNGGQHASEVRISPQHSSQFSANTPWRDATIGPSILTIVSRHAGSPDADGSYHQSATPAPPTNATRPSTMSSSRWVRLLARWSRYHISRW